MILLVLLTLFLRYLRLPSTTIRGNNNDRYNYNLLIQCYLLHLENERTNDIIAESVDDHTQTLGSRNRFNHRAPELVSCIPRK